MVFWWRDEGIFSVWLILVVSLDTDRLFWNHQEICRCHGLPFSSTSEEALYCQLPSNLCLVVDGLFQRWFDSILESLVLNCNGNVDSWRLWIKHVDMNVTKWWVSSDLISLTILSTAAARVGLVKTQQSFSLFHWHKLIRKHLVSLTYQEDVYTSSYKSKDNEVAVVLILTFWVILKIESLFEGRGA